MRWQGQQPRWQGQGPERTCSSSGGVGRRDMYPVRCMGWSQSGTARDCCTSLGMSTSTGPEERHEEIWEGRWEGRLGEEAAASFCSAMERLC